MAIGFFSSAMYLEGFSRGEAAAARVMDAGAAASACVESAVPVPMGHPLTPVGSIGASTRPSKLGHECTTTKECDSPELFCEYTQPGCDRVKGICEDTKCRTLPMNFTYCGCDGKTNDTRSMCKPSRPFKAWEACTH